MMVSLSAQGVALVSTFQTLVALVRFHIFILIHSLAFSFDVVQGAFHQMQRQGIAGQDLAPDSVHGGTTLSGSDDLRSRLDSGAYPIEGVHGEPGCADL